MLKQVTGTSQFDQKINGMLKSIEEGEKYKGSLQETLQKINGNLTNLKGEIEIFSGFEKVEKEKKAFERCIYEFKLI